MDTVWCINLSLLLIHHDDVLFIIHSKYCDTVASVIGNRNMLVIREDHKVFWIITADRKCELLCEKTTLLIYRIHGNGVFACC